MGAAPTQRRNLLALPFAAAVALVTARASAAAAPGASAPAADSAASRARPVREVALLAGGCFWTVQAVFDRVDGVLATTTGYAGGSVRNPTYEQVLGGRSGHVEAVLIEFDVRRVSYTQLLDIYWRNIDPTRENQQFCDIGRQYNAVIFALGESQRAAAEASKTALERSKPFTARIRTPIVAGGEFFPAEEEHQRYFDQSPERYAQYVRGCGRERRLRELWGR
ncbi:MAG: peptide-methionine (S)-S-oxide reductase MsrA [Burkholderiaceae bacterium]|nr:peptide-methionine (S)-S-oxide reductase MsrA [Burkholderiaceae bacterium]